MTVFELTERELVARIEQQLAPAPSWLAVGIGDDAAVVEPERNRLEVLTVDAVIDGVHFDRRFTPPDAIGHRALAVNLSDLAAMGAAPRLALLSLALPADLSVSDFDAIVSGITTLAAAERVTVIGGNLTRTPGPLTIDITVSGTVKRRDVMRRNGAQPGDLVYVTGTIGAAAAGLEMLRGGDSAPVGSCVGRYLRPSARTRFGLLLGRNRAASSCVDLSDGLADGVARIAAASQIGITLDAKAVPVDPAARHLFEVQGREPLDAAIVGGDDYELLFTVRPRLRGRLKSVMERGGVTVTQIGVCTGDGVVGMRATANAPLVALPAGFTHFR